MSKMNTAEEKIYNALKPTKDKLRKAVRNPMGGDFSN